MSDVSGIPNLGIPALSGFNGGGGVNGINQPSGLASAQEQAMLNQRFFGNQAATLAAAHVPQSQLYGGGFFGAQPAYHAGVGAAYGRATGGFGGYGAPNADPFTPVGGSGSRPSRVGISSSPFDVGNAGAVPYLSGGGMPFGGGGFSGYSGSPFSRGAPAIDMSGGGGPFGGGGFSPGGHSFDSRFAGGVDPSIYAPAASGAFGRSRGTAEAQAPGLSQPSPYTPNFDAAFDSNFSPSNPTVGFSRGRSMPQASYDAGAVLPPGPPPSRFDPQSAIDAVNQFSGVGTEPPTAPGRNTGGANPFTSGADPITNLGSPFAAGRGFQDTPPSPFDVGAPGIGATLLPAFNNARPGGGIGRGQAPPDFAPSSPFEGGTSPLNYAGDYRGSMNNQINQTVGFGGEGSFDPSAPPPARGGFGPSSPFVSGTPPVPHQSAGGQAFPVPGIGGYRGTMRDQIAAIMSGSQGMNEPTSGGPQGTGGPMPVPLPQSRPSGAPAPGTPFPTQPQMNDAWRRIGSGPGSPGVSSIAQQTPPPPPPYARINQAIYDIGNVSQPAMFDNLSRPLSQMFSPGRYRGR